VRITVVIAASLALVVALATPARADPGRVAGLQVALKAKGLYGGPVDGVAGPRTLAALRVFQRRAGLAVDGVAGPRTRRKLGRLGRPLLGRRAIRRGSVGWDVSVLQFMLRERGLRPGRPDGRFGPATEAALRRFQRRARLAVDGVVGPATIAALAGTRRSVRAPGWRRPAARRYRVRPGDTLTGIAGRFGTTVPAVARANRLDPARVLLQGLVLRVPVASAPRAARTGVRGLLDHWAAHYRVDVRLVRALAWQESGFQPRVVSRAGALGVMQVTPATWDYVETMLIGRRVARTVSGNVRIGVAFLRHLLRTFGGRERLAIGAYYQGAHSVRKRGLIPETRRYVANVLALRTRV
jgi:soluble lytic murein transglycosylase-like protein